MVTVHVMDLLPGSLFGGMDAVYFEFIDSQDIATVKMLKEEPYSVISDNHAEVYVLSKLAFHACKCMPEVD